MCRKNADSLVGKPCETVRRERDVLPGPNASHFDRVRILTFVFPLLGDRLPDRWEDLQLARVSCVLTEWSRILPEHDLALFGLHQVELI